MDGQLTPDWLALVTELYGIRDPEAFLRQLVQIRHYRRQQTSNSRQQP